tara:strand:- start:876 stop:3131 length:2256 start_codon:yes stop_codon:yes gene_type:complete
MTQPRSPPEERMKMARNTNKHFSTLPFVTSNPLWCVPNWTIEKSDNNEHESGMTLLDGTESPSDLPDDIRHAFDKLGYVGDMTGRLYWVARIDDIAYKVLSYEYSILLTLHHHHKTNACTTPRGFTSQCRAGEWGEAIAVTRMHMLRAEMTPSPQKSDTQSKADALLARLWSDMPYFASSDDVYKTAMRKLIETSHEHVHVWTGDKKSVPFSFHSTPTMSTGFADTILLVLLCHKVFGQIPINMRFSATDEEFRIIEPILEDERYAHTFRASMRGGKLDVTIAISKMSVDGLDRSMPKEWGDITYDFKNGEIHHFKSWRASTRGPSKCEEVARFNLNRVANPVTVCEISVGSFLVIKSPRVVDESRIHAAISKSLGVSDNQMLVELLSVNGEEIGEEIVEEIVKEFGEAIGEEGGESEFSDMLCTTEHSFVASSPVVVGDDQTHTIGVGSIVKYGEVQCTVVAMCESDGENLYYLSHDGMQIPIPYHFDRSWTVLPIETTIRGYKNGVLAYFVEPSCIQVNDVYQDVCNSKFTSADGSVSTLPLSHKGYDCGADEGRLMGTLQPSAKACLLSRMNARFNAHPLATSTYGPKYFNRMNAILSLPTQNYDESSDEWQFGDQGYSFDPGHLDEARQSMQGLLPCDMPWSVMLAVDDGAKLRVRKECGAWETIKMRSSDVFMFRGDVEHYGLGYKMKCVRVHCHWYAPNYKPAYPIQIHDPRKPPPHPGVLSGGGYIRSAHGVHCARTVRTRCSP